MLRRVVHSLRPFFIFNLWYGIRLILKLQGTVLFLLRRRLHNIKSYQKQKSGKAEKLKLGKGNKKDDIESKDLEGINAELLKEVKKKKKNFPAIYELQSLSFSSRRAFIQNDGVKLNEVVEKFPFLKEDQCVILNELQLYCRNVKAASSTMEEFELRWAEIARNVADSMSSCELDTPQEMDKDDTCGALIVYIEHIDSKFSALLSVIENQDINGFEDMIFKETTTNQPTLWCTLDEDSQTEQMFLVIDKKVFIELSSTAYFNAMLVLIGSYFTFNLSYDKSQQVVFRFIEEFVLGMKPTKKSVAYRKFCSKIL